MKKTRNTAFIVELLLLFVILLFVIVTITRTFLAARSESQYAGRLTMAVCLAEDVAEVSMSAADREEAVLLFSAMDQTEEITEEGQDIILLMKTDRQGVKETYRVVVNLQEEKSSGGLFTEEQIMVYYMEDGTAADPDPLYTLNTGNYRSEGGA